MLITAALCGFYFILWNLYCCETNCTETNTVAAWDLLTELFNLFGNPAVHVHPAFCLVEMVWNELPSRNLCVRLLSPPPNSPLQLLLHHARLVAFFCTFFFCLTNIYNPCDLLWNINDGTVFLNRFHNTVFICNSNLRLRINGSCEMKGTSASKPY